MLPSSTRRSALEPPNENLAFTEMPPGDHIGSALLEMRAIISGRYRAHLWTFRAWQMLETWYIAAAKGATSSQRRSGIGVWS
jgi:hypothetical protein